MMRTTAFHNQVRELYQRGLTPEQIAFRTNRPIEVIGSTLYRAGLGSRECLTLMAPGARARRIKGLERKRAALFERIHEINAKIAEIKETAPQ